MVASLTELLESKLPPISTEGLEIIGTISDEPIYLYIENKKDPLQRKVVLEGSTTAVSLEALQKFRPYEPIKLNDSEG